MTNRQTYAVFFIVIFVIRLWFRVSLGYDAPFVVKAFALASEIASAMMLGSMLIKKPKEMLSFVATVIATCFLAVVVVAESGGYGPISAYWQTSKWAFYSNVIITFIWPMVIAYDWYMIEKERVW